MLCENSDVMSFYKEELAGELNTYVQDRASASNTTSGVVLGELVEESAVAFRNARDGLSDLPLDQDAWTRFAVGYFYFHVYSERYRLRELEIFS